MKETAVVVPEEIPAVGVVYNTELPGRKSIMLQTHFAQSVDVAEMHKVVDKLKAVADRQFAQENLVVLRIELEQQEKLASDHLARMTQVDVNIKSEWARRGKKGDPSLNPRESDEQRKSHAILEECRKRIAKVKGEIAANEAVVAGA